MKILGIESASLTASVAVVTQEVVTAEYTVNFKKTHSQTLLPMLDEIVKMTELDLKNVDAIAVSGGPGSFTGLRIGSATAKGLGLALDEPLIHIPTLEAMAWNFFGTEKLVCPMMDARRGQVYTGIYRCMERPAALEGPLAVPAEELAQKLNRLGEPVIFLGDGVPAVQETLKNTVQVPFCFAPPHLNRQRAAAVAALGLIYYREGRTETAAQHVPNYLRPSQAERELKERQKKEKDE